jgi:peptide/nickel transport system permease protein
MWRKPEYFVLGCLLLLALARDFIANGRPLYCRIGQETHFPGLRAVIADPQEPYGHIVLDSIKKYNLWRSWPYQSAVFAPVAFSPGEWPGSSMKSLAPPGTVIEEGGRTYRHWLGTDDQGRDVAAGMVAGARTAILTGIIAVGLSLCIGLLLGGLAGFWGDDRMKTTPGRLIMTILGVFIGGFYAFIVPRYSPAHESTGIILLFYFLIFISIVLLFNWAGKYVAKLPFFSKTVRLPLDMLVMRSVEVFSSVPRLVFIIAVAAATPAGQSLWLMIGLLGVLSWTGPARFFRGELLRIREMDYISAARGLGFSEARILWRHALPNAVQPLLVQVVLGMATAMLLESAVSFLGYGGTSFAGKSWGNLLLVARQHTRAWWLALPPGLAIFAVVMSLNLLAERYSPKSSEKTTVV